MNMQAGVGMIEMLLFMLIGLPLGMPPGERDAKLLQCAPADTVLYAESSAAGNPASTKTGWDGFLQDEEIKILFNDTNQVLDKFIKYQEQEYGDEGNDAGFVIHGTKLVRTLPRSAISLFGFLREPADKKETSPWMKSVHGAVLMNVGEQAGNVETSLLKLLQAYKNIQEPAGWDDITLEKLNELKIPLRGDDAQPLIFHRTGNYISISYGESAHQHVVKGLAGESQGFAESKNYLEKIKPQLYERQSQLSFLDVQKLLQGLVKIAPEESLMINSSLSLLGLQKVEGLSCSSGLVDGQVQTRNMLWTDGELNGLLTFLKGPGIKPGDLAHLPADVDLVVGYSFDALAIFESIKQLVTTADQNSAETMDESIKSLEEVLGVSLTEDLLPALGHTMVIHDAPSQGGTILTAPVLKLSLKKPEIMENVLNKLCKFIKANNTSNYPNEFHTREFLGQKIYNFGYDHDDDFLIHFSWTFTTDSMYLTLHPSTLKAQIRLVKDEKMLKLPAETLKLFAADAPVISCTYLNLKDSIHALYTIIPYALTALNNEFYQEVSDEMFDIQDALSIYSLPSMEAVMRYDAPSWSIVTKEKTGIKFHTQTGITGTVFKFVPVIFGLFKAV